MRKKQNDYLDIEAMKLGYQSMLDDVILQLEAGANSIAIQAILKDRKTHIQKRLGELS